MDCYFQSVLTDEQLWRVIDGEADDEVRAHLAQCGGCMERLEVLQQFEAQLKRSVHPTSQQLANFQIELLSEPATRIVAEHVAQCEICQQALALLVELSADVSVPDSLALPLPGGIPKAPKRTKSTWADTARELIAHLLPPQGSAPRLAGVNVLGYHANILTAEAEGLRIHLTMEAVRNEIAVSGQLITDEEADQAAWEGATVAVTQLDIGARVITLLTDLGEFTCPPLPPGSAYLRIRSNDGRAVVLDEFQLVGRRSP